MELTREMLIISVYNSIFKEKLDNSKAALETAVSALFERKISIECVHISEQDSQFQSKLFVSAGSTLKRHHFALIEIFLRYLIMLLWGTC